MGRGGIEALLHQNGGIVNQISATSASTHTHTWPKEKLKSCPFVILSVCWWIWESLPLLGRIIIRHSKTFAKVVLNVLWTNHNTLQSERFCDCRTPWLTRFSAKEFKPVYIHVQKAEGPQKHLILHTPAKTLFGTHVHWATYTLVEVNKFICCLCSTFS